METAMNWELPAKTITDMSAICKGESPALAARTPKGIPTAIYPIQMGTAAARPWRMDVRELDCMAIYTIILVYLSALSYKAVSIAKLEKGMSDFKMSHDKM
jgi:hypothetical protein